MKLFLLCLLATVTWSYLSRPRCPITRTVLFAETGESDLPPSNDFDIEKVLSQIAVEKGQKRAADAQQALDEKRAVLQKRSDKNYEKYWVDKEKKELSKESKELATLRSYYSGGPNRSNSNSNSSLSNDNAESGWDYQAVPVNPSQGDGITTSVSFGVALLATALIVGKKILSPEADSKKKRVKPVRGAINMPGIGIVNVD